MNTLTFMSKWLQMVLHLPMNTEASAGWAIQCILIQVRKAHCKQFMEMSWKVKTPPCCFHNEPSLWKQPWLIQKCHVRPVQAGRGSVANELLKSLMKEEGGECLKLQFSSKELGMTGMQATPPFGKWRQKDQDYPGTWWIWGQLGPHQTLTLTLVLS